MISKKVTNENILKLRELTDRISNKMNDVDYESIVKDLKKIIDEGKDNINKSKDSVTKLNCYESMCQRVTAIINSIKIEKYV